MEVFFLLRIKLRQAFADELSALDPDAVKIKGRDGLLAHAELQVGKDDDRSLELFSKVEGFLGDVVAVFDRSGRKDDLFRITMAGADRVADVALFHLGRHARGRAGTHDVDDDDRDLCGRCHGDRLCHQGEPWAGGRSEGTNACIAAAHRHHAGRELIFGLYDSAMDLMDDFDHVFHDLRRRRDRVGCHEAGPCGNRAKRCCFIAEQVELVLLRRGRELSKLYAVHRSDGRIIAVLEDRLVFRNDFIALLGKAVGDEAVEWFFRESQHAGTHAERCDILHLHAAVFLCQLRDRERKEHTAGMRFKFRVERIIGDDDAAFRHFLAMDIDRFLIECDQTVYMLANGRDFFRRNTQCNGGVATLDTGSKETLAEQRVSFLRQDLAEDLTAGLDTLSLLAAHLPDKITFRFQSVFLLDREKCLGKEGRESRPSL